MIYIWIRSTINWEDTDAVTAQLSPEMRSKVEVWNDTFTIPFHLFRHRVRQISVQNASKVEDATFAPWDEIPEGSLVLPADDDDWFAPDVGRVLQGAHDPRAAGYHWIASFIEVPINLGHRLGRLRRRILPRTPSKWICTTNNYALVKGPESKPLLQSHTRASEWFEEQAPERVKGVGKRLSVMNRTLGSQTSLAWGRPSLTRRHLIGKFRRYRALYRSLEVAELPWCRPYVAMMADLMDQLEER